MLRRKLKSGDRVRIKSTKEDGTVRSILICGDVVVRLDKDNMAVRYRRNKVQKLAQQAVTDDA